MGGSPLYCLSSLPDECFAMPGSCIKYDCHVISGLMVSCLFGAKTRLNTSKTSKARCTVVTCWRTSLPNRFRAWGKPIKKAKTLYDDTNMIIVRSRVKKNLPYIDLNGNILSLLPLVAGIYYTASPWIQRNLYILARSSYELKVEFSFIFGSS